MHQKEAQKVQHLIDSVKGNDENLENNLETCSSAVLASQIKKIIPSKVYENHRSSVAAGLEKIHVVVQQKKKKSFEPLSKRRSIHVTEMQTDTFLIPETKEEAVDPNVIKVLPVPLPEKKIFRDTLTLPPSKVPWKDKIMQGVRHNYKEISYSLKIWDDSLKEIEGYLGAGAVSYFLFLRLLLLMNCFMMVLIFTFLVLPSTTLTPLTYSLPENFTPPTNSAKTGSPNTLYKAFEKDLQPVALLSVQNLVSNQSKISEKDIVKYCHKKYFNEIEEAKTKKFISNFQNLLQGTGWMEPTIMFLGSYPIAGVSGRLVYNVPLAFILVFIIIYLSCFIIMMLYSSFGIYEAITSQNYFAPRFANSVFSAWDYCIRDSKNAEIHHRSFANNIREENHPYHPGVRTLMVQYLPALSVTTIRTACPLFFSFLSRFEHFHARTAINLSLARSAFIGLSSVVILVISFQHQILCQPVDICGKGKSHCHAPMCWETYVGQELYKLNVSEFFVSLFFFFLRIARDYTNKNFHNKFAKWVGCAEFFLPQEVLALIYLQTITWMGVLYAPLLPLTLILKFTILFYTKKAEVLKYARPATTIYKASRFNSMYISILMISYLIVLTVQFFAFRKITPSYGCSPFRYFDSMSDAVDDQMKRYPHFLRLWKLLLTGWFFVPAYILLCFLIYYNWRRCSILKMSVERLTQELIMLGEDRQFLLQKIEGLVEKEKTR